MDDNRDAAVDAVKSRILSAAELFRHWPRAPAAPLSTYGTTVLTVARLDDPRLLLLKGRSDLGPVQVGWCLFGVASNLEDDSSGPAPVQLARALPVAVRRILQYLAVDQDETQEAAAAELARPVLAEQLAAVCGPVTGLPLTPDGQPVEFGASVYALASGHPWPGGSVDVTCLGVPMWIRPPLDYHQA